MLLPIVAGAQKYVPVQKGDKWGVQKNGEWTIKPKYLSIQPFGKNFVVKAKHHEKEWKQKWMLLSPEGQDVLNRNCWKIEIYDAQAAIVNEANIINTEGKVLVHAFKVKPTEIPGLLFCSNYPKDFYFSLVSGEKYTFQGGKIQRLENDLYYVYKITSHTDSGRALQEHGRQKMNFIIKPRQVCSLSHVQIHILMATTCIRIKKENQKQQMSPNQQPSYCLISA